MKNVYLSRIEKIYNTFNEEEKSAWDSKQFNKRFLTTIKLHFYKKPVQNVENYTILKEIMYYDKHRKELIDSCKPILKMPKQNKIIKWKVYKVGD